MRSQRTLFTFTHPGAVPPRESEGRFAEKPNVKSVPYEYDSTGGQVQTKFRSP